MQTIDERFIQLALQIGSAGMQGANAYNAAQAELALEKALETSSLATAEGTRRSLEVLSRLSTLTVAHKSMFASFTTVAVTQLAALLAEFPKERAAELRDEIVSSVNWNLQAQAQFYVNRNRWIEAASAICRLVEEHRETISFTKDGVVFDSGEILGHFN